MPELVRRCAPLLFVIPFLLASTSSSAHAADRAETDGLAAPEVSQADEFPAMATMTRPVRADGARVPFFVVAGGVGLAAVSAAAFTTGLDIEKSLVAERHDRTTVDNLLTQRAVAAWIAWPTAVAAGAAIVGGGVWSVLDTGASE